MMPTQEQIKKVLIEEFSDELNEFFGKRKTTQISTSFERALPKAVRGKVINTLGSGITSENFDDVLKHLMDYYTASGDEEVGGFVLALRAAKRSIQEQIANLQAIIKKAHGKKFSDLALILVPQILKNKGIDIGLTGSEMTSLKALSKPTGAGGPAGPSPTTPDPGDSAGSNDAKDDKKPVSDLKDLSKGKVNVALNQLRNRGKLSAQIVSKVIDDTIKDISKTAGPQKRNFIEKDVPIINLIKKELVKILSGDFSSLQENNSNSIFVHPLTYKIINELLSKK